MTIPLGGLFNLGRLMTTQSFRIAAIRASEGDTEAAMLLIASLYWRHAAGDWGDVPTNVVMGNYQAVRDGGTVISVYPLDKTNPVLMVTSASRLVTAGICLKGNHELPVLNY